MSVLPLVLSTGYLAEFHRTQGIPYRRFLYSLSKITGRSPASCNPKASRTRHSRSRARIRGCRHVSGCAFSRSSMPQFLAKTLPGREAPTIISSATTTRWDEIYHIIQLAQTFPKYKFFSFLYPTMESMVFTALYSKSKHIAADCRINHQHNHTVGMHFTNGTQVLAAPAFMKLFPYSRPTIMDTASIHSDFPP